LSKEFSDWETLYKSQKVETMQRYNEKKDKDISPK